MTLLWCERAAADRLVIFGLVAQQDLDAAVLVDERIEAATQVLHAASGPVAADASAIRSWPIDHTRFMFFYRVDADCVRLIRVLHRSRMWPEDVFDRLPPGSG